MCPKDTAHFLTSPKIPDAKGIFVMIQFTPVGDSGVLAVCGSEISEQVNAQVMALDAAVQAAQLPGVVETVPTYAALLVTLDPLQTDADTLIPAGAVGIGGKQTGIYPLASPGGWRLIGRTPLRLFDPAGGGKLPYAAGDRIRFVPISPEKFETIQKEQGAAL